MVVLNSFMTHLIFITLYCYGVTSLRPLLRHSSNPIRSWHTVLLSWRSIAARRQRAVEKPGLAGIWGACKTGIINWVSSLKRLQDFEEFFVCQVRTHTVPSTTTPRQVQRMGNLTDCEFRSDSVWIYSFRELTKWRARWEEALNYHQNHLSEDKLA